MMNKKSQLSSEEAVLTFKNEVGNCLALLGFVDGKDKENVWKFWKTITSAVKIAVNGKGDILSSTSPMSEFKANERAALQRSKAETARLKNLSNEATTVYVPLNVTDTGHRQYHVLKFINQEKVDDYVEIVESGDSEVLVERGEFHNKFDHPEEITFNPDKIIAQVSQLDQNNVMKQDGMSSTLCDQQVEIISLSPTSSQNSILTDNTNRGNEYVMNKDELDKESRLPFHSSPCSKKEKVKVITWPVRKPTTRLSSHAKERNSIIDMIPVKMRGGGNVENKMNEFNSPMDYVAEVSLSSDVTTTQTTVDLQNSSAGCRPIVSHTVDKSLEISDNGAIRDQIKSSSDLVTAEHLSLPSQPSEVWSKKAVKSKNDILRKTLVEVEVKKEETASCEFGTLPEAGASVVSSVDHLVHQPVDVLGVRGSKLLDVEDKGEGHDTKLGFQQQVISQKSSPSDIETIISALEEELKKSGSGVHSISITSTNDPTPPDLEPPKEEVVELLPGQEIVEVQNVEDVIWNPDGSVQVVGTHTLIDSTQNLMDSCQVETAVNEDGSTVLHPIDAQYDVVEYEVFADKGKVSRKMGSSKRRRRDKEIASSEDKDILDRTCPMCHRVLTYPSSMAAHMRIHTGDRPYSCGQCDRKFTTKANRDRHEATHVGLKPFKCTECDKCFTEKRSLKIHMRSHTGERPFVCTVCNRGFAQKCTLMVHMDRHTNRKGHLCDLCGKAFRQKCQLDIHVKRHNRQANYPCPDCSIKCYTKGDLVRHMIKHTGERPFQCNLCPRTFTRKQYLMDHENTHYGRKPYKCSVCSIAFHDMGSCHRHVRKHREESGAKDGEKALKAATILTADDYDTIVKDSQAGKILTLEDGTQALVTAVDTEADGSTVYHITCVGGNQQGDGGKTTTTETTSLDEVKMEEEDLSGDAAINTSKTISSSSSS